MTAVLDKNDFDACLVPGARAAMKLDYAQLRQAESEMVTQLLESDGTLAGRIAIDRDCVMCGADRSQSRLRYFTKGLRIVTCGACDMTYSQNVLTQEADRDRYVNSNVPQFHQNIRANPVYGMMEAKKAAYLAGRLGSRSDGRGLLLDVGCSTGVLLDAARSDGWRTLGIEANPDLAAVARGKGHEVTVGFFPDVLPAGLQPDAISMLDVLEHAERPMDFLHVVAGRLPADGRLLIQVPNFDSLIVRLEGAQNSTLDIGHWSYFTPKTLDDMLARAGFRALGTETIISEMDKIRTFEWDSIRRVAEEISGVALTDPDELTIERLHALGMGYKVTGVYARAG
jgi:2-polyprenyl-3-methyl-5-hydroxy-6-metoxy-1,4-benzoquinol methylase